MSLNKIIITLVTFVVVIASQNTDQNSKLVTIAQGPIRGYKNNARNIFEFFGIPYATTPTGPDRFKAPLPPRTWTEPLEAINTFNACPQDAFAYQSECLIANIYAPDSEETNLPVLVIVHGGGYDSALGHFMVPEQLVATGKIIAVTFNYRLGVHGFLCLGTKDIPGNAGLKDQVALLRWVRENIANFGGNPNDVSLGGFSAGGSAVDLLMLSKAARGLFNKVIPESGGNLAYWSSNSDPIYFAKKYARQLNFTNVDNLEALEEFYKTVPLDILVKKPENFEIVVNGFYFCPCVEHNFGEETFLEDSPYNIIKSGDYVKLPLLYGFTDMEGLVQLGAYDYYSIMMNEKFSDFLPIDLTFESEEEKEAVAQSVKQFYFGDNRIGIQTFFGFIDFWSDTIFNYPMLRSARMYVEGGHKSVYLYLYTFNKRFPSIPGVPDVLINSPGAHHIAQTEAVFQSVFEHHSEEDYTPEYRQMKSYMQELWLNFILTGQPVPAGSTLPPWTPVVTNSTPHMHLGETIELRGLMYEDRAQFWDQIYDQYYRLPVAPVFPEPNGSIKMTSNILFLISFVGAKILLQSQLF